MWKEHYKLNVAEIDKQHQELFNRTEKFIKTTRKDLPLAEKIAEIEKTLAFMEEYVVIHFDAEEKLQQEISYPDFKAHKKIHEEFKLYVKEFKDKFKADKENQDLIMEFSGRLMTWLINHVANEDQKLSNYITEQKGGN